MNDPKLRPLRDESSHEHWHYWKFVGWKMLPGHWEVLIGCSECDARLQVDIDADDLHALHHARIEHERATSEQPLAETEDTP